MARNPIPLTASEIALVPLLHVLRARIGKYPTQKQVAQYLGIGQPPICRRIARLTELGLVVKSHGGTIAWAFGHRESLAPYDIERDLRLSRALPADALAKLDEQIGDALAADFNTALDAARLAVRPRTLSYDQRRARLDAKRAVQAVAREQRAMDDKADPFAAHDAPAVRQIVTTLLDLKSRASVTRVLQMAQVHLRGLALADEPFAMPRRARYVNRRAQPVAAAAA